MRALIAVAVLIAGVHAACAKEKFWLDGNRLYGACQEDRSACMLYAQGLLDGLAMEREVNSLPKPYCIPSNAVGDQITDVVTAYLRNNPAMRQYNAGSLVLKAMADAFPCK